MEDETIGFPYPDLLANDDQNMTYIILGDDTFGLITYLMKPYSYRGQTKEELITTESQEGGVW